MLKIEQANRIKKLIEEHEHIALFHHTNPDGDCMATSFGLAQALRDNYPNKNIKVVADIEDFTPHLRYMDDYVDWDNTITTPEFDDYLLIIGDVSGVNRVNLFERFENHSNKIIVYDHHENEITIPNFDEFWSEPDYPAAALMAYELLNLMDLNISQRAAVIINHGILTDTQMFRLAPGDKRTFDVSGKLNEIIGEDIQKEVILKMDSKSINDIKFDGWVFDNFKILENKLAYICINKDDLERFNYRPDQASKTHLLSGIEGIESWIFFTQYENNIRVELRSLNIWVDEIATEFGGGGHHLRAGARIKTMDEHSKVIERVLEVIKQNED